MSAHPLADHYAVLGVPRSAGGSDLRRAYHRRALALHPDLAGAKATDAFQRLAEAYRVLSDPEERSAYDARLRAHGGAPTPRVPAPAAGTAPALARVSGSLEALLEQAIARRASDGAIELPLTRDEARTGGTVALEARVSVGCPTCFGLAARQRLWCRRCEYAGMVPSEVTACLWVPPSPRDGLQFWVAVDPLNIAAPLRVRVRRA